MIRKIVVLFVLLFSANAFASDLDSTIGEVNDSAGTRGIVYVGGGYGEATTIHCNQDGKFAYFTVRNRSSHTVEFRYFAVWDAYGIQKNYDVPEYLRAHESCTVSLTSPTYISKVMVRTRGAIHSAVEGMVYPGTGEVLPEMQTVFLGGGYGDAVTIDYNGYDKFTDFIVHNHSDNAVNFRYFKIWDVNGVAREYDVGDDLYSHEVYTINLPSPAAISKVMVRTRGNVQVSVDGTIITD